MDAMTAIDQKTSSSIASIGVETHAPPTSEPPHSEEERRRNPADLSRAEIKALLYMRMDRKGDEAAQRAAFESPFSSARSPLERFRTLAHAASSKVKLFRGARGTSTDLQSPFVSQAHESLKAEARVHAGEKVDALYSSPAALDAYKEAHAADSSDMRQLAFDPDRPGSGLVSLTNSSTMAKNAAITNPDGTPRSEGGTVYTIAIARGLVLRNDKNLIDDDPEYLARVEIPEHCVRERKKVFPDVSQD
ncbi:hypothetical protein BH10PSE18_BH10PSE18_16720 [soil metagenome]